MEETLEKPVVGNRGIAKAVELLLRGGQKDPAESAADRLAVAA